MWKFNPFNKDPAGLEGRTIDVGTIKVTVRNPIAEGGFSCVYLARDAAHTSREYALKHIICNDEESLELVMKEIAVLRGLRGHPNVVRLVEDRVIDMGRTKEAMLVMEYCEKSLVGVLEGRCGEWFEEKEVMVIFRDVCNAVRALHLQSPPIAHRDLKAENILLGSDGSWKLCDFGSISTKHKCFSKPEEMGLEEDNIRKHTTPAYRAPEMWDLFRREIISEKVDIWALGCLLYRICYLKPAFDGESKLQVLNGNYRVPESPTYSASTLGLIKSMLEDSPDARPDITQVCICVNELLTSEQHMPLSNGTVSDNGLQMPTVASCEGAAKNTSDKMQNTRPLQGISNAACDRGTSTGAFWSTQHAKDTGSNNPNGQHIGAGYPLRQSASVKSSKRSEGSNADGFEVIFSCDGSKNGSQETRTSHPESKPAFQNEACNTFVSELDTNNHTSVNDSRSRKIDLEAEVNRLQEQLKDAVLEKSEITSKYENLSAICRSQRQELQELKRTLSSTSTLLPIEDRSRSQASSNSVQQGDTLEGGLWELQQGMFTNNPEPRTWQAFPEKPNVQPAPHVVENNHAGSGWATSSCANSSTRTSTAGHTNNEWSFGMDNLSWPLGGPQVSSTWAQGSTSQMSNGGEATKVETGQPAGWAGF